MENTLSVRETTTRVRLQFWTGIFKDRADSGLNIKEYCLQHNLSRNQYFYWQRRAREMAMKTIKPPAIVEVCEKKPDVVEIPGTFTPELMIRIGNATIEVPGTTSEEMLTKVIRAIKNA